MSILTVIGVDWGLIIKTFLAGFITAVLRHINY